MTLTELAEAIADKTGFSREETWAICDELVSLMARRLKAGDTIKVRGLGTFSWVHRRASRRRHPLTGDLVAVPARLVLRFKPASELGPKEDESGEIRSGTRGREGQARKRGKRTKKVPPVRK
jgi:nucleoid DNA-binding protein